MTVDKVVCELLWLVVVVLPAEALEEDGVTVSVSVVVEDEEVMVVVEPVFDVVSEADDEEE